MGAAQVVRAPREAAQPAGKGYGQGSQLEGSLWQMPVGSCFCLQSAARSGCCCRYTGQSRKRSRKGQNRRITSSWHPYP